VPDVTAKLKAPKSLQTATSKFEDVVKSRPRRSRPRPRLLSSSGCESAQILIRAKLTFAANGGGAGAGFIGGRSGDSAERAILNSGQAAVCRRAATGES